MGGVFHPTLGVDEHYLFAATDDKIQGLSQGPFLIGLIHC